MKKKKKVVVLAIVLVVIISLIFTVSYFVRVNNYRKSIASITVQNIDLAKIDDGEYEGSHNADFISVNVVVTIKDHKIVDIEMEHYNDRGAPADVIPDRIIEEQPRPFHKLSQNLKT